MWCLLEASEDLNDLDLRFAEKISAEDDWEEVWEMRKKSPTPVPCLHTLVGGHGVEALLGKKLVGIH